MPLSAELARPLLVFDGDCAFCTTSVLWLQARFPEAFDISPYQRTNLANYDLTEAQCHARVQWVCVGRSHEGAHAVGALLRFGGHHRGGLVGKVAVGFGSLAFIPPASWVAAGIYAVIAANRQRMPGGTPACKM